jgi:hypothetical protein
VSLAEDTDQAAQLLAHGLRPKVRPIENPDYRELVCRYRQQDSFARTVRAVANGMGLDVTEAAGVVLGAREGSAFAMRMEDYYRRTRERNPRLRVLHGLAQLAIAATSFPRPDDLEDEEHAPRVAVNEVDEYCATCVAASMSATLSRSLTRRRRIQAWSVLGGCTRANPRQPPPRIDGHGQAPHAR